MKTIHLVLALLIIFLPGCQESAQTEPSPSGRRNHVESGFVEANGQKLYYEIHGRGKPLVLIQGLAADATAWAPQIPAFQQHFKVIAFDNRDVGRSSPAKGPYNIADMAEDTTSLMHALGIKQAYVVGVSMGGMIAQELVLRHPDKVRKLVLGCTVAHVARFHVSILDVWKWIRQHDPTNEIFAIEAMTWGMTRNFLKNAEAVNQMMQWLQNPPFPVPPEAYGRQADAVRAFDALDRLGTVRVPTLVLVGDQDILTPTWASRELAAAIPGAKLQVLEGGAHGFFLEIPDKVNQAVIDFLTD